jgi:DNA-binding IclR family transcriptional regulator
VTALARGLEVLSCFRGRDRSLGNQELAKRCGLPKSTVSRLTYTLTRLGYLEVDGETGRYRLGSATLSLGSAMLSRMDVRQRARPLMQRLADETQTMVSLGARDRLNMIYVENCRSDAALTLSLDVGSRLPLANTAMGRAYLVASSEAVRQDLMERLREAHPAEWPQMQESLASAFDDARTWGVCCSFGQWQSDVNAIALAFVPHGSRTMFSLNCGGPAFQLSREYLLERVRPRLMAVVNALQNATPLT